MGFSFLVEFYGPSSDPQVDHAAGCRLSFLAARRAKQGASIQAAVSCHIIPRETEMFFGPQEPVT
jgi:hypothetical protein